VSGALLTVNTGSSSVKAAVYDLVDLKRPLQRIDVDRVGAGNSTLRVTSPDGSEVLQRRVSASGFEGALLDVARQIGDLGHEPPAAVGHRVVHGGPHHSSPQLVTNSLLVELRNLTTIDPQHLPQAVIAIETASRVFPGAVEVACFDTAFHRDMPHVAQVYALPLALEQQGVLRYGFHGLSYESIVAQLRDLDALPRRMVVAHLGNGSSMAAIVDGRSVDTTMGLTPTGGLVMGTRCGDLDPGVVLYLMQSRGMDASALSDLFNRGSGLLGLSETSSDMRDLLAAEGTDKRAALAIEVYCYVARKFVAAMAAAMGGLDCVVFTGGIGEHGTEIRRRICNGLEFLGVTLDAGLNSASAAVISPPGSLPVRVMRTDEDATIARHTARILAEKERGNVHV
jgi:acetate kinase